MISGSTPTGAAHWTSSARRRFGVLLAVATTGAITLTACSGGATDHPAPSSSSAGSSSTSDSYGSLPTYLPTTAVVPDSMLTGSPGRPAVTSEGDRVLARYDGGTVQAEVDGPVVPGEGLPYVADATTATWTVHFDHATVPVPIRLADFLAVDEEGHPYRVQFVPHAAQPPAVLKPGHSTSFELRVVMATGEGVMRWQPGGHLLGLWDFVVEND